MNVSGHSNYSFAATTAAVAAASADAATQEIDFLSLDCSAAGANPVAQKETRKNPKIDFDLFKQYAQLRAARKEDEAQAIFDRLFRETDQEAMTGFLKLVPYNLAGEPRHDGAAHEAAASDERLRQNARQQGLPDNATAKVIESRQRERERRLFEEATKMANKLLKLACESPHFFTYTPYVLDRERMAIRDLFTFMRMEGSIENDPYELSVSVSLYDNRRFTVISCADPTKLKIEIQNENQRGEHIVCRINPGKINEVIRRIFPPDQETFFFFIPNAGPQAGQEQAILGYTGIINSCRLTSVELSSDGRFLPASAIGLASRVASWFSWLPPNLQLCMHPGLQREPYYESCFPEISALEALTIFDSTHLYRAEQENSLFCFINLKRESIPNLNTFLRRVFGERLNARFDGEAFLSNFLSIRMKRNLAMAIYSPDGKRFFFIDIQHTAVDEEGKTIIQILAHKTYSSREGASAGGGGDSSGSSEPTQLTSSQIILNHEKAEYYENGQVARTFTSIERQAIPQFYLDCLDGKKHLRTQPPPFLRMSSVTLAKIRQEDLGAPAVIKEALDAHPACALYDISSIASLIFQYSQEGLPSMALHDPSEYVRYRVSATRMAVDSSAGMSSASRTGTAAAAARAAAIAMPATDAAAAAAAAAADITGSGAASGAAAAVPLRRSHKRNFDQLSVDFDSSSGSGSASADGSGSSSRAPKRAKHD